MAISDGFIEQIRELLAPMGHIGVRKMFGGAGIYADGVIIAIASDDILYFKVDATTRGDFAAEGTGPFRYPLKTGEQVMDSYWRAPERLFDEPDEMVIWARKALAVSRAAGMAKKKPATKSSRSKR